MAINDTDPGFSNMTSPPSSPPSYPSFDLSTLLLPSTDITPSSSLLSSTPVNLSAISWQSSSRHSSPLNTSGLSTSASSWAYMDGSFNRSGSQGAVSPPSRGHKSVWSRLGSMSPVSGGDNISDEQALARYLHEDEDRETKVTSVLSNVSSALGSSFWSEHRPLADYTPLFKKYPYQLSQRPSQSPSEDLDSSSLRSGEELWARYGARQEQLYTWTERLRQWLSQTVLARLVSEIDAVNSELQRLGSPDIHVGAVSLITLRQAVLTRGGMLPTLPTVLAYLELTDNQEYLVHRIRELAAGGSIGDYRWKSGSSYKGKAWGDLMPTDTAILIHLLCVYLDSRLPPHPAIPDGRTFTSQHLVRTPDSPDVTRKDALCIYQSQVNPPHFRVAIGEDVLDVPKGRNNFFHAVLLFLYHIKTKENGMLGRINLGLSGINILWIFDDSVWRP